MCTNCWLFPWQKKSVPDCEPVIGHIEVRDQILWKVLCFKVYGYSSSFKKQYDKLFYYRGAVFQQGYALQTNKTETF